MNFYERDLDQISGNDAYEALEAWRESANDADDQAVDRTSNPNFDVTIPDMSVVGNEWRKQAACKGLPLSWFFPNQAQSRIENAYARAVCARCVVRSPCLESAILVSAETEGIWGETSFSDRRILRRQR